MRSIQGAFARDLRWLVRFALGAIMLCCCAANARAQPAKWSVTVEGAFLGPSSSPQVGDVTTAAGSSFTTVVGRPGRHESTWLAGDGAALLNDVLHQLGVDTARVTPLDRMSGMDAWRSAWRGAIGARLDRQITPRVALEIATDVDATSVPLDDALASAVRETSTSFGSALTALIGSGPFAGLQTTPTITVDDGMSRSATITGGVRVDLMRANTFTPYVVAAAGVRMPFGGRPTLHVSEPYNFLVADTGARINETDDVRIELTPRSAPVVVAGAGVSVGSGVWRLRLEGSARFVRDTLDTTIRATPAGVAGSIPDAIATFTTPSLQFSNITGNSTLSGSGLTHTTTTTTTSTTPRVSVGVSFLF